MSKFHESTPRPPPDFNAAGWTATGALRLRTSLFGFAVVESQHLYCDGTVHWIRERAFNTFTIKEAKP